MRIEVWENGMLRRFYDYSKSAQMCVECISTPQGPWCIPVEVEICRELERKCGQITYKHMSTWQVICRES